MHRPRVSVTVALFFLLVLPPSAWVPAHADEPDNCTFEAITYQSDGLTIRAGVFYIDDGRPHPLLVYNHATTRPSEETQNAWERNVNPDVVCRFARDYGWVVFFAERRGYGGSEGPRFFQALNTPSPQFGELVAQRLRVEARDVLAGIRAMRAKPSVTSTYALWGVSGGGIIALLLVPTPIGDLRGVIATSPGVTWDFGCPTCVYRPVIDAAIAAGLKTRVPILIQTGTRDVMRVADRRLYDALGAGGSRASFIEYPGYTHESFGLNRWRTYLDDIGRSLRPP